MQDEQQNNQQENNEQNSKRKRIGGIDLFVGLLLIMIFAAITIAPTIFGLNPPTTNSTVFNLSGFRFIFPNDLNYKIILGQSDLIGDFESYTNNVLRINGVTNTSAEIYLNNGTPISPWLYNQTINNIAWNRSGTNVFLNNLGNYVGIGTTTPTASLHVNSSSHPSIIAEGTDGYAQIELLGTGGQPSYIWSQDLSTSSYAGINSLNLFTSTKIGFMTGSSSTPKVIIDATGKVGIGAVSPGQLLHVKSTTGNALILADGAGETGFGIYTGGTPQWEIYGQGDSTALKFYNWVTAADRMTITSTGNVGINTASPSGKLEVSSLNDADAIRLTHYSNITMQSPNGMNFTCGVNNNGVFSCG